MDNLYFFMEVGFLFSEVPEISIWHYSQHHYVEPVVVIDVLNHYNEWVHNAECCLLCNKKTVRSRWCLHCHIILSGSYLETCKHYYVTKEDKY
jgi:hypothetical protein